MDELTFATLKIVVSVCAALITAYAVPYIKALREDEAYSRILDIIDVAVRAAEQVIRGQGQGSLKKAEAVKFVSEWMAKHGLNLTEDHLDQLIEAAVYEMKQEA